MRNKVRYAIHKAAGAIDNTSCPQLRQAIEFLLNKGGNLHNAEPEDNNVWGDIGLQEAFSSTDWSILPGPRRGNT